MIEEAIVHVGMHKTGASSIQDTLSRLSLPGIEYLSLNLPNHSEFLVTVLADSPEEYHSHVRNGLSMKQVQSLKESYTQHLHSALKKIKKPRVLISAEDLSRLNRADNELEKLKNILLRYCKHIRVIGYVRSPSGYMQSAFQQKLKGANDFLFNLNLGYPNYYKRFSLMDAVFGEENVELVAFDKNSLKNGDVVQDFAHRINVELSLEQIVRRNESLSLEATALLYTFRRYGGKENDYEGFRKDNNRLITLLSGLGEQKLVFSKTVVAPVIEKNIEDIEWMSKRLGSSILDEPSNSPQSIGSEEDLLHVAYENRLAILKLLEQAKPLTRSVKGLAQLVDKLHLLKAQEVSPLLAPELTLFTTAQIQEMLASGSNPAVLLSILSQALVNNGQQLEGKNVRSASNRAANLLSKARKDNDKTAQLQSFSGE